MSHVTPPEDTQQRVERFTKVINSHGYPLQYALLLENERLLQKGESSWHFEAAEFPVSAGGKDTKIDFILRSVDFDLLLLAECKRVDDRFSDWCFWKTRFVRRGGADHVYLEYIFWDEGHGIQAYAQRLTWPSSPGFVHLGISSETKKKEPSGKGDNIDRDDAIERSSIQVIRSMNGMAEFYSHHPAAKGQSKSVWLLPMIVTTARLWVCNTPLQDADLQSGKYPDVSALEYQEVDHVLYQYHVSPSLRHHIPNVRSKTTISSILALEHIRTIPIVTARGFNKFIRGFEPRSGDIEQLPGS